MLLVGCAGWLTGRGAESEPLPTLNPALLTVTPPPTSTPLPTFTPFPTAERMASRTPLATLPSFLTALPATATETPIDGGGGGGGSGGAPPPGPGATPTTYVGVQGTGPEIADLATILTIASDGAICNGWTLIQVGVINRGTGPAYNFTVEWSLGWGAMLQTEFVRELQWGTAPIYFYNGTIQVPCEETTTYKAWIRLDVNDDVAELFEDNNYDEEIYTITYVPPGD